MDELISRQAVLALPRNVVRTFFGEVISETVDVKMIEALPTIEPRRNGNWVNGCCSECGRHALFWRLEMDYYESNFCPHCGADMRGENNERVD